LRIQAAAGLQQLFVPAAFEDGSLIHHENDIRAEGSHYGNAERGRGGEPEGCHRVRAGDRSDPPAVVMLRMGMQDIAALVSSRVQAKASAISALFTQTFLSGYRGL